MPSDYSRLIFDRLVSANAEEEAAREQVFEACRQEIAASIADPGERTRELDRLEQAIRRHRLQGQYEDGLRAVPPVRSDEIYESVRFEHLPSGNLSGGTVGWRDGSDCWVMLQVLDGPEASAGGASVQQAYDTAARKMARHGYAALLADGHFPFEDGVCHAKRYAKRRKWARRWLIAVATAALLLAGIAIGARLY